MIVARKHAILVLAPFCALLLRQYQRPLAELSAAAPQLSFSTAAAAAAKPKEARGLCGINGTPHVADLPPPPALHDGTVELSRCVERPWIGRPKGRDDGGAPHSPPPPYKLLLTNFCWNQQDKERGLRCSRYMRSRELVQSIVDHPYFDPVDWDELNGRVLAGGGDAAGRALVGDNSTRYYVFLDAETCREPHYPVYGGHGVNMDTAGGRSGKEVGSCFNAHRHCKLIPRVLGSPLFRRFPHARLIFLDCSGFGRWDRKLTVKSRQFAQVSLSATTDTVDLSVDQGLPPPLLSNVSLSPGEVRDIETCRAETSRPYFFTFVGALNRGKVRKRLTSLHDPDRGVVSMRRGAYRSAKRFPLSYSDVLKQSVFAAAPAGDNRYSYRFTEVLAAGAIPVVHSDGWLLPFRPGAVNWTECLLHLPEATANDTITILRAITPEQRCRMRRRCRAIYTTYMTSAEGNLRGILESLETVQLAAD